jgi:hypothetical protein
MYPINYSKFSYYKIDPNDLDSVEPTAMPFLGGGPSRMVGIGIDEPCCQVVYEDFFPGHEYKWTTWVDQLDFVVSGKAEITFYQPPSLEVKQTVLVEAPCIYLLPRGTPLVWKVIGEKVFRHFSFDVPNPLFPTELAKSVKIKQKTMG